MRHAIHETIGDASTLHLSFDRSHLAQMPTGGALWIVEGGGVICAFRDQFGTSTCQTSVQARKHGLLLEVFRPNEKPGGRPTHFLALGIAPSWARSVAVKIGRIRRKIPVLNHRYALTAKRPIEITQLLR
jgi:exopolyphosphatase/pppGpp-phosphohydrolase